MSRLTQLRKAAKEVRNPKESEKVRTLVGTLAKIEEAQRRELIALHEALGLDELGDVVEHDHRVDELCDFIQAYTTGDLRAFWLEYYAPEMERVEDAKAYLGLSDEEWEDQISRWAESYRANADLDEFTDRDLAREHVMSRFGVSLGEFERMVVNWSPEETMEEAIAGPLQQNEDAIATAAAAAAEVTA
jgi:hypothetical protein